MNYLNEAGLEYLWDNKIKPISDMANTANTKAQSVASGISYGTADVRFANDTQIGYTSRNSRYWVVGEMCFLQFSFLMDGTKPATAVVLALTNLPVPPVSTGALLYPNSLWASSLASGYPSPQPCFIFESYGTFSLYGSDGVGRTWSLMTSDWIPGNGTRFNGTIIYKIQG